MKDQTQDDFFDGAITQDTRLHEAELSLVNDVVPIGSTSTWPLSSALLASTQPNWVIAGGQAIDRITYSSLFSVYGTTFGVGDGATTFNVPIWNVPAPVTWTAVSYNTNWHDFGGAFQTVQYCKDALGFVHLRGLAQKSTAPAATDIIFTLPAGYQPPATLNSFIVKSALDAATNGFSHIDITTGGAVTISVAGQTGAANGNISMNGIVFDVGTILAATAPPYVIIKAA